MTRVVLHTHPDTRFARATSEADGHVHGVRSWLMDMTLWATDSAGTPHYHRLPSRLPGPTSEPLVDPERAEENGS